MKKAPLIAKENTLRVFAIGSGTLDSSGSSIPAMLHGFDVIVEMHSVLEIRAVSTESRRFAGSLWTQLQPRDNCAFL